MERNYCALDGTVTDRYIAYARARAASGAALLFTEATYVRADGRGRLHQMGAHGDHVIPGLRALADAVHAEGALLGVELNHAGRSVRSRCRATSRSPPRPCPVRRPVARCHASRRQTSAATWWSRSRAPPDAASSPAWTCSSCTARTAT